MSDLSYSLHLGSDKNRKNISRSNNNLSNTTSLSNNAIQNKRQLSKVDNHNARKYDNDTDKISILKGTDSIYNDVEKLYKNIFDKSRIEYNKKQTRPSRMIDNYFDKISNDEKRDLACEIIIELGDKDFWEDKDIFYKTKMEKVFEKQISDLENLVPNFKIANAIVHYDETSPHLHIVGVPIKEGNKNGMSLQVGKSDVFTKESLADIQLNMRNLCIQKFNEVYQTNYELKEKVLGRNKDIHVMDMEDYKETMKEIETNRQSIKKTTDSINEIKEQSKEIKNILESLDSNLLNYKLSKRDKYKIEKYVNEMNKLNEQYEELFKISSSIQAIKSNNDELKSSYKHEKFQNTVLTSQLMSLHDKVSNENDRNSILEYKLEEAKDNKLLFLKSLSEAIHNNPKDRFPREFAKKLYEKRVLNRSEYRCIIDTNLSFFNPREVEAVLHKLNREAEQAAEEFYNMHSDF